MAATPSRHSQTKITSDHYRLGLRWWLGKKLVNFRHKEEPTLCPGCDKEVDEYGDHLVCCSKNNFDERHRNTQLAIAKILDDSNQGYSLEEKVPARGFGDIRPADILLKGWLSGKDTAVDLTIRHGWQGCQRKASKERWRLFLRQVEQEKHTLYDRTCQESIWEFKAMAIGTWGGMGPEGTYVLNRLIKRAASWHDGDLRAACQDQLHISVGLALMKSIWTALYNKNLL